MFFDGVKTLNELKDAYRKLAKKYHPDLGGDGEVMKKINDEHDRLFEILKARHNEAAEKDETHKTRVTTETAEEFRDIVIELFKLDGLNIELCGSWLWIGGDTMKHKVRLKELGCRWAPKKGLWSWHHLEDGSWGVGASMSWIRKKYGSVRVVGTKAEDEAVAVA